MGQLLCFRARSHRSTILTSEDLYKTVKEKKKQDPKLSNVCFHAMKDLTMVDKPGSFSIDVKTQVHFNIQDRIKINDETEGGDGDKKIKTSFQNAGALIPINLWQTMPLLKIMWSCKWSPKGLVPVCPKVVVNEAVSLPTGTCIKLS